MVTCVHAYSFSIAVLAAAACASSSAKPEARPAGAAPSVAARDRQHDLDFHVGTWRTHVRLRPGALSGPERWVEYEGTTLVRPVWNGRANLVELVADDRTVRRRAWRIRRARDPAARAAFCGYCTDLLLSAAPSLLAADRINRADVDAMSEELAAIGRGPGSIFFYAFVQARCVR